MSFIVGALCFFGTGYDIILRVARKKKMGTKKYSKDLNSDSSGLNCTTYDLTSGINGQKINGCVGIAVPNGLNNNNSDENLAMEAVVVEEEKISESKKGLSLTRTSNGIQFQVSGAKFSLRSPLKQTLMRSAIVTSEVTRSVAFTASEPSQWLGLFSVTLASSHSNTPTTWSFEKSLRTNFYSKP